MSERELFKPANYNAYLIRLWQENRHTPWRASAQCATTGEKHYFATIAALYRFLDAQTSHAPTAPAKHDLDADTAPADG